jgi:hypothetical protein
VSVIANDGVVTLVYSCELKPQADSFAFEHDEQRRLFTMTGPDGKTQYFCDNPGKYLMVEPDPKTGDMQPVGSEYVKAKPRIEAHCRRQWKGDENCDSGRDEAFQATGRHYSETRWFNAGGANWKSRR